MGVFNLPARDVDLIPGPGKKSICRRKWHPTLVFLPGKSHGQRSLVGSSPWCREELDTAEATERSTHIAQDSKPASRNSSAYKNPYIAGSYSNSNVTNSAFF